MGRRRIHSPCHPLFNYQLKNFLYQGNGRLQVAFKINVESNNMKQRIKHHWELEVYQMSMDASMRIFRLTKKFPIDERYSLTDQIRRSSRSVSSNIA